VKRLLKFALLVTLLAPVVAFPTGPAQAQGYPTKPVRIVVPFPPGGTIDILARLVSEGLARSLGQSVVVDNRAGAGGIIGSHGVVQSPADGYTLLMASPGPMTVSPALKETMPYDTAKDLTPIIQVAATPLVMVVPPSLPVKSLSEFVEYAKARPGKLSFASSGAGTSSHLSGEMFKLATGVDMVHVPYKGGGPALTDVLGGRIETIIQLMVQMQPHIASGKLRALAITSRERAAGLPDVPTMIESGHKDFEVVTWFGLFAPKDTPSEIVKRLNEEVSKILSSPETAARLTEMGALWRPNTPAEFAEFVRADLSKWKHVVEKSGLPLQP